MPARAVRSPVPVTRTRREPDPLTVPALEAALKCSHLFNVLEARGALSVTERAAYIARIRKLSVANAKAYLAMREAAGFPLLRESVAKG